MLQLIDVALAFVLLTQFLLDGLHLLAQVVLALRLLHLVLHFGLDLVAQLLNFQFLRQMLVNLLQPNVDVRGFQYFLLVRGRKRRQRRGDEIHQPARLFDIHRDRGELIGQRRRSRHDLLEQASARCAAMLQFPASSAESTSAIECKAGPHERRQLRKFA